MPSTGKTFNDYWVKVARNIRLRLPFQFFGFNSCVKIVCHPFCYNHKNIVICPRNWYHVRLYFIAGLVVFADKVVGIRSQSDQELDL